MIKKVDDFKEMYESLTDPLKLAEARRKDKIKKQADSKKKDTGL